MKPYYEEAGIQIFHADCRDVLPTLPKVDLVLTDPPFEGPAKHTDDFGRLLGWQDSLIDEALERAEKPCDGNPT